MKRREEQLEAWAAKRAKPLASLGNNTVAHRPPKAGNKRAAVQNKSTSAKQRQSAVHDNKENHCTPVPCTAPAASKHKPSLRTKKEDQQPAAAPSKRSAPEAPLDGQNSLHRPAKKATVSASSMQSMENQYDMLKGTFDTLKRESIRSVKRGTCSFHWGFCFTLPDEV